MAVKLRVLLVLGLLAGLTACQLPTWRDDVALWGAAARRGSTSPRPAFNYAVALRVAGRYEEAADWLERAAAVLTEQHPREGDYRQAIRIQFALIEATGHFVCDSASRRPLCF